MTSVMKRDYYYNPIVNRLETLWKLGYDIPEMRKRIHGLLESQMDLLTDIGDLPYYGRTTYRCMLTGGLFE